MDAQMDAEFSRGMQFSGGMFAAENAASLNETAPTPVTQAYQVVVSMAAAARANAARQSRWISQVMAAGTPVFTPEQQMAMTSEQQRQITQQRGRGMGMSMGKTG